MPSRIRIPHGLEVGVLATLAAVLILAGCYPGSPSSLDEVGLVVTHRNPEGTHTGLLTYAMIDTVVELKNPDESSSEPLDRQYDQVILESLQEQLANAGFRRVDYEQVRPDAWVRVGSVQSDVWIYWQNWGYWGGYWGPGYRPPYSPSIGVANFKQGPVTWELLDLRGIPEPIPPDPEPVVNWLAGINGAIQGGSASTNENSIRSGIQQAFVQSPYIEAAPAPAKR